MHEQQGSVHYPNSGAGFCQAIADTARGAHWQIGVEKGPLATGQRHPAYLPPDRQKGNRVSGLAVKIIRVSRMNHGDPKMTGDKIDAQMFEV